VKIYFFIDVIKKLGVILIYFVEGYGFVDVHFGIEIALR